ncbi:MAG: thioredoxin family protein [Candidatus Verstraetearchaeota archaeon]|jgi:glutaredoxin|nr:thioredoxin family protein [Candidatus Verstraetearchaeota archaeon]
MARVKLYVSPQCPRCETLKRVMNEMGVEYEVLDVSKSEVMVDLIMRDIFLMETPGLEVDGKFFHAEEIFDGERLIMDKLRKVLGRG